MFTTEHLDPSASQEDVDHADTLKGDNMENLVESVREASGDESTTPQRQQHRVRAGKGNKLTESKVCGHHPSLFDVHSSRT